ncbi:nucleotide binding family protein [Cryptosporidium bovis]|uniref:nucleotide binding family protein n=1 Tax=Cryptosporidium bovis TaxID=310047 RepID=UPI00351A3246|nr:nucleotide binding family protein [Cryptosporidium bovis]
MNRLLTFFSREVKNDSLKTQENNDVTLNDGLNAENESLKSRYAWYPPIPQGKLIDAVRSSVPNLCSDLRKGSLGKIGIIGGSSEYSGAPYFAGISSLKIGADLCHIFCTPEAAIPIKCYSPDLIVHPLLPSSQSTFDDEIYSNSIEAIRPWLSKLDIIVIGCGLGREKVIMTVISELIKICRSLSIPIVIDADGLYLISKQPDIINGYKNCILTPNLTEFTRLENNIMVGLDDSNYSKINKSSVDNKNIVSSKTPYIQIQNEINKVNHDMDTSINVPRVLPLGTNGNEDSELKSPCERTPNIEWPSINTNTKLQFHDDGEEINLFFENEDSKENVSDSKTLNESSILISNPLRMCFYEHVINENCVMACNRKNSSVTESSFDSSGESFLLIADRVFNLSRKLGNLCIVLKDKIDIISNGNEVAICNIAGTLKRSGGQGDILSGVISTLFNWGIKHSNRNSEINTHVMHPGMVSTYGACLLVRLSAHISYKKRFRSIVASDLVDSLPYVFNSIFEVSSCFDKEHNTILVFNEPYSPTRRTN